MHAFLYTNRVPLTIKARGHLTYENDIKEVFRQYWPSVQMLEGDLYGIVYYFHRKPSQIDADNLCKPVFDALENELYVDDGLIKFVKTATFDLRAHNLEVLDLTTIPGNIFSDFLEELDKSDHILYIEIGDMNYEMFEFGRESQSE
jgi:Holliday junction resolvase RusA-like endonuclease